MTQDAVKPENIKLQNPVVVRKVPMSRQGANALRAVKEYQLQQFKEQMGKDVELQWPTCIHLMLMDYIKIKGLEIPK